MRYTPNFPYKGEVPNRILSCFPQTVKCRIDTDAAARVSQQLQKQDKGLWNKIKGFFKGLVERLKKAYAEMTPDSAIARETKRLITQSEAIRNAWVDAVSDSVMNYQLCKTGKKRTPGRAYSIRYGATPNSKRKIGKIANGL